MVPPAQWGDMHARAPGEEECELLGDVPPGHVENVMGIPSEGEEHQAELDNAASPACRPNVVNAQEEEP